MKEKTAAIKQVPELDFETILRLSQKELKQALAQELTARGYAPVSKKGYLYAQGEVPVMLVAHLDTVHREPVKYICYTKSGNVVMSPQGIGGDDRCGVWMILQIIREARCHILFCEDEEIGCQGAQRFCKDGKIRPNINYIVELDRRGHHDAVFYRCENPEFTQFICGFGFTKGHGTCSDISYLAPHLDVSAVNISSGYYGEHRPNEFIRIDHMEHNIQRVTQMVLTESPRFPYQEYQYQYSVRISSETASFFDTVFHRNDSARSIAMPLPEGARVHLVGQEMDGENFYMNEQETLLRYIPELGAAVELEQAEAFATDGTMLHFRNRNLKQVQVISTAEAIEHLQQVE